VVLDEQIKLGETVLARKELPSAHPSHSLILPTVVPPAI